jgi:SAM-dependent methyltransferase
MARTTLEDVLGYPVVVDAESVSALDGIEARWPADLVEAGVRADRRRLLEQVAIVRRSGRRLLDIGGGYCPFGVLCAAVGFDVDIVDSYMQDFFSRHDLPQLVGEYGVRCQAVDVVRESLPFEEGSFDVVTSFDSLEHWHHSPRGLFAEIRRVLRPGGLFLLGVPNAVNLRKRIAVLGGKSNWSHFEDWYYPPDFHGHVREPTRRDLERTVPDLGLEHWAIFGRNWLGYRGTPLQQALTALVDRPLRLRPTLCADLYLVGRRGD